MSVADSGSGSGDCEQNGTSIIGCKTNGGLNITVHGEFFGASQGVGDMVRVGGKDCPAYSFLWTDTNITCRLPPGAGMGRCDARPLFFFFFNLLILFCLCVDDFNPPPLVQNMSPRVVEVTAFSLLGRNASVTISFARPIIVNITSGDCGVRVGFLRTGPLRT